MKNIKITFLGTGSAIPTEKKNHNSIFIELENRSFLVDCGEGTQRQFKYSKLSPHKIDSLFITHWHGDHILGIPGLLQTLAMTDYQKTLHIYGPKGTQKQIELIKQIMFGIKIKHQVHEVQTGIITNEKTYQIIAEEMDHDIPCLAYSFIIKDTRRLNKSKLKKLALPNSPILRELQEGKDIIFKGKKIKSKDVSYLEKGKKATIILDTAYNQNTISLAKDSDILISESSFLSEEAKKAKEYKHLTASQAAEIAKKAKVKLLFLTHLSQRYEHCLQLIEKEAKKIFKNTKLAKDLDTITI